MAREVGLRDDEAVLLLNMASVAHLQGDENGALTYAHGAFDSAVASGQRDLEAFALLVVGHAELGLGRCDAARRTYVDCRDRLRRLQMSRQRVLDPMSGPARVALAQGAAAGALQYVELLMGDVAKGGSFDGTEEPLLLLLTCWRVLHAAGACRAHRRSAGATSLSG